MKEMRNNGNEEKEVKKKNEARGIHYNTRAQRRGKEIEMVASTEVTAREGGKHGKHKGDTEKGTDN
jgi:hypothetical protein